MYVSFRLLASEVESFCADCEAELHGGVEHDLDSYEALLEKFSDRLVPSNYIILTVKKYIADLIGSGGAMVTKEQLDKKIKYLKDFVRIIEKVDPGYPKVSLRKCL